MTFKVFHDPNEPCHEKFYEQFHLLKLILKKNSVDINSPGSWCRKLCILLRSNTALGRTAWDNTESEFLCLGFLRNVTYSAE